MLLDADLFRRIVGDAPMPLPPDADDRRATGRVFLGRRTYLTTRSDPAAPPVGVVVRDVSPGGVGLLTTTALPVGDTIRLILPLADLVSGGPASVIVECRTRWRR